MVPVDTATRGTLTRLGLLLVLGALAVSVPLAQATSPPPVPGGIPEMPSGRQTVCLMTGPQWVLGPGHGETEGPHPGGRPVPGRSLGDHLWPRQRSAAGVLPQDAALPDGHPLRRAERLQVQGRRPLRHQVDHEHPRRQLRAPEPVRDVLLGIEWSRRARAVCGSSLKPAGIRPRAVEAATAVEGDERRPTPPLVHGGSTSPTETRIGPSQTGRRPADGVATEISGNCANPLADPLDPPPPGP